MTRRPICRQADGPLTVADAVHAPCDGRVTPRVLVLSPFGGRSRHPREWGTHLAAQVAELRARGSRVETISPESNSQHLSGSDAMDLSLRPPAARAGYGQGLALAEQLAEFWR